jgi:hypothetical protein
MLLQLTHITTAMSLDAAGVTMALRKNYPDDSVLTAVFAGMTANGSFVYACTYNDEVQGFVGNCTAYVQYDDHGRMSACY